MRVAGGPPFCSWLAPPTPIGGGGATDVETLYPLTTIALINPSSEAPYRPSHTWILPWLSGDTPSMVAGLVILKVPLWITVSAPTAKYVVLSAQILMLGMKDISYFMLTSNPEIWNPPVCPGKARYILASTRS